MMKRMSQKESTRSEKGTKETKQITMAQHQFSLKNTPISRFFKVFPAAVSSQKRIIISRKINSDQKMV